MNSADEQILDTLRGRFRTGDTDGVISQCEALLASSPAHPRVLEILGLALARANRSAESLAVLQQARRAAPGDPQINYNLAVTLQESGDTARAMLRYRDCLRANAQHVDALWNYGELLRVNDFFDAALRCFREILVGDGSRPDIDHRMAVCLAHLGHDDEADAAFQRALQGQSTEPALTHWEYAHFLLSRGEWADGWRHYDYRFETTSKTSVSCHSFGYGPWQGESLAERHLLVHGEQGLGDEIMFCSVVPELRAEARKLTIACQPPLVRLFASSFPHCTVLPHVPLRDPAPVGDDIDVASAMGSLCRYRRCTVDDFSRSADGYLRATPADIARFARHLDAVAPAGDRIRAGLMWNSNPARGVDWGERRARRKSIPIRVLDRLGRQRDVQFVSLQNRDSGADAAWAPSLDLVDLQDDLLDLADTAALIANLDLVISVDTSVAHLAGALGAPTWVLLMNACDWRWGRAGDTTPWYASARLFRQPRDGDWDSVVSDVALALDRFVEARRDGGAR